MNNIKHLKLSKNRIILLSIIPCLLITVKHQNQFRTKSNHNWCLHLLQNCQNHSILISSCSSNQMLKQGQIDLIIRISNKNNSLMNKSKFMWDQILNRNLLRWPGCKLVTKWKITVLSTNNLLTMIAAKCEKWISTRRLLVLYIKIRHVISLNKTSQQLSKMSKYTKVWYLKILNMIKEWYHKALIMHQHSKIFQLEIILGKRSFWIFMLVQRRKSACLMFWRQEIIFKERNSNQFNKLDKLALLNLLTISCLICLMLAKIIFSTIYKIFSHSHSNSNNTLK